MRRHDALSPLLAGTDVVVTVHCMLWTRLEKVCALLYFKAGLQALDAFPPSALKLRRAKSKDGAWLKGGDPVRAASEYDEMYATGYLGYYASRQQLRQADVHVVVYLPRWVAPPELQEAQADAATAAQHKARKRAERRATRRNTTKRTHKPARRTRAPQLRLCTEELRKRIFHAQQYHRLGDEVDPRDLELYVKKTRSGEWLTDEPTTHALTQHDVETTVGEFLDGDEHGVDDDVYVAVVRPQVDRHGRALSRTDSSNSTPSDENEGLSHAGMAYETPRWSFAQWMTLLVDWVSTNDAIVAKKCE